MLTAGRSVLLHTATPTKVVVTVLQNEPGGDLIVDRKGLAYVAEVSNLFYIGERSDDGWITAPPGGWIDDPIPGRQARVRLRSGWEGNLILPGLDGRRIHKGSPHDIIAFRLVEEASPVAEGLGSSAKEADTHCAADGAVVAASPLEIAYGCLWRVVTDEKALHEARAHVRRHISHNGQQRGVAWAVANLPAVSDAEIRSIDI